MLRTLNIPEGIKCYTDLIITFSVILASTLPQVVYFFKYYHAFRGSVLSPLTFQAWCAHRQTSSHWGITLGFSVFFHMNQSLKINPLNHTIDRCSFFSKMTWPPPISPPTQLTFAKVTVHYPSNCDLLCPPLKDTERAHGMLCCPKRLLDTHLPHGTTLLLIPIPLVLNNLLVYL